MEGKRGSERLLKSVSNIDFNPHIGILPNEYRNLYQHKKFETITLSDEFDANTQP
ncbi:hypothetical protein NFHkm12_17750 [Latilactobacillus curvatus]|uniref:Transposase n=1 Tax=Latilactobacillus curvatus TaxID=28038 RepID=A0ABM7QTU4_LATCU|nr:hypothetical protein NFHkm12_17750 [Latilactobacillus curvatus]BCX30463.1 hypothetical protein LTWDN19_10300 [Latilactobacillus curvatus]